MCEALEGCPPDVGRIPCGLQIRYSCSLDRDRRVLSVLGAGAVGSKYRRLLRYQRFNPTYQCRTAPGSHVPVISARST
ncbi:hypothetical protein OH77DRAFT_1429059 [Trametes cingulata]|nr:hypothetical protein OH77DRAFT_1429059 [Trametes cingulata]